MQLSIIIPCYNAEKYIKQCIERTCVSISHEFILVNDGSIDETSYVLDELKTIHSNIRVIHKENGGVIAARRDGWRVAKGEYVCFVDADDYCIIDDNFFQVLNQGYDVIKAGGFYVTEEGNERYSNACNGVFSNILEVYSLMLDGKILPYMHTSLFRRDIIDEACFDIPSRFAIGEDFIFNLNILKKQPRILCVDYPFYYYSMNIFSVMHTKIWSFNYIRDFENYIEKTILENVHFLQKELIKRRFLCYTSTLLFPEIKFKHSYYVELKEMFMTYPWLLQLAPKRNVMFIQTEWMYRLYLGVYHTLVKMCKRTKREVIE